MLAVEDTDDTDRDRCVRAHVTDTTTSGPKEIVLILFKIDYVLDVLDMILDDYLLLIV
jgi:hypothetical protein